MQHIDMKLFRFFNTSDEKTQRIQDKVDSINESLTDEQIADLNSVFEWVESQARFDQEYEMSGE